MKRPPTPSLDVWRRLRGRKPITVFDDLWRAACWEAQGLEFWRDKQWESSVASLRTGRGVMMTSLEHLP